MEQVMFAIVPAVALAAALVTGTTPGGTVPPNSPFPGTPTGTVVTPYPPVIIDPTCTFRVHGQHHRKVDVRIVGAQFPTGSAVTLEVVKGGAAWIQQAHTTPGTAFVRFRSAFAGHRTVTVVLPDQRTLTCGRVR